MLEDDNANCILMIVKQIPHGKVATYGQIAKLAGIPRNSRQVGTVLKTLPENSGVPWFRVVNSRGEISDRSPNKTVRQAFNVTARAVQNWAKDRGRICVDVPHQHLSPEKLRNKMLECGQVYSREGRGAPSVN